MPKRCVKCGYFIPAEKLKFFPETNICSASCANRVKVNEKAVQNKINNIKTKNISEKKSNNKLEKCEKCGGTMLPRKGPWGFFFGCSNFPKCKNTKKKKGPT